MLKDESLLAVEHDVPRHPAGHVSDFQKTHIRGTVESKAAQACEQYFGLKLRALILTGSLARNEESVTVNADHIQFLSDVEFVGILHEQAALPTERQSSELAKEVEARIAAEGITCHIGFGFAHDRFLREMRPHIFAYELRTCGRVLSGQTDILSLIPPFTAGDIPLEDAWRLLSNRMVELLEALSLGNSSFLCDDVRYRVTKTYLDMATSLLIFTGRYSPLYHQRALNIQNLNVQSPSSAERIKTLPFDLASFSGLIAAYTRQKFHFERPMPGPDDWNMVRNACEYASKLWIWEMQEMTGAKQETSPLALCLRLTKHQELDERIRGWAFVMRHEGWLRSCPNWARWIRLAAHCSPRYWIYGVAAEIFSGQDVLASVRETSEKGSDCDRLFDCLPVLPRFLRNCTSLSRRELARALGWNYHHFLEGTRG